MMENPRYTISPQAIANGINDLLDEKEELQERIDKAIEYIEKHHPRYKEVLWDDGWYYKDIDELLDILKGSDSNDR